MDVSCNEHILTRIPRIGCVACKTKVKQGKLIKFISSDEGYIRETCKSESINPISATPKFALGIITDTVKEYRKQISFIADYNR